jgi:hypothetical protein
MRKPLLAWEDLGNGLHVVVTKYATLKAWETHWMSDIGASGEAPERTVEANKVAAERMHRDYVRSLRTEKQARNAESVAQSRALVLANTTVKACPFCGTTESKGFTDFGKVAGKRVARWGCGKCENVGPWRPSANEAKDAFFRIVLVPTEDDPGPTALYACQNPVKPPTLAELQEMVGPVESKPPSAFEHGYLPGKEGPLSVQEYDKLQHDRRKE